jgi:pimeloyl-ACP methyl ester carboxylesterase
VIATSERPSDEGRHPRLPYPGLVVRRWGSGPEVVLVHGSVTGAHASWAELRRRAHGWTLVAPNRRGYHPRTPTSREDFRADAADIARLCCRPVHLVGHSYGAVVALLAAARTPGTIKSLTLIEPPPLPSVHGIHEVRDWVHRMTALRTAGPLEPAAFLTAFMHLVGGPAEAADYSDQLRGQVELLRSSVPVWTADPPWRLLLAGRIPALVVSGGHNVVFETAADDIAERMAGTRHVLAGAGHFVQRHPGFVGLLTRFLRAHEPEPAFRTGDSLSCSS